MKRLRQLASRALGVVVAVACCAVLAGLMVDGAPVREGAAAAEDAAREPWTTSRVRGTPEPPPPYLVEHVFPGLRFQEPVELTSPPGGDRLFVAELGGKVFSFPDRFDATEAELAIDLREHVDDFFQLYGMTFHPRFSENGYVYICYVLPDGLADGTRVSRFTIREWEPPRIDPASEEVLITWLSGGHNGGCLEFGPDGYLYISTGDAVGPNPPDALNAGQDITNLLSAVLRIDVDRPGDGTPYRIPEDNPFVDYPGARPEIWAYGFRNPWKMSFDRRTGELWLGDVGWELWELVHRIEPGGNYGWSIMEGRQPINPDGVRGPTPIIPPVVDHPHSEAASVTGGIVYYGRRLPELYGAYVYGDWETGKIWGLRYEDGRVTWHEELADTDLRFICFGDSLDQDDVYFMDFYGGTLHRLADNPRAAEEVDFPRRLSETGLFDSVAGQLPVPGVVPYRVAAEPWEEGAVAQRWVGLPGQASVRIEPDGWRFPDDSVLVKTLSLPIVDGDASSLRRIETQLLHFDGLNWRGYSYAWRDDQLDAELVAAEGRDQRVEILDADAPDGRRVFWWRFAARAECMRCHNPWSGSALGWNALQLDVPLDEPSLGRRSQLEHLAGLAILDTIPPAPLRLVDPHDAAEDLELRARSYLHANCAHCHRMHAGGSVLSEMQLDIPLADASLIDFPPAQGTFGLPDARVVASGDPLRSALLYRVAKTGAGRMPRLTATRSQVDARGLRLLWDWVEQLPASGSPAWLEERAGLESLAERLAEPLEESERERVIRAMLASPAGALRLAMAVGERSGPLAAAVRQAAIDAGAAHESATVRELFVRFLPEAERVDASEILALHGDAQRGWSLFWESDQLQCRTCHRIGEAGQAIGPDLSQVGERLDRHQLLEAVLEPSRSIDPQYRAYLLETTRGQLFLGLLVRRTAAEVVLRDAQNVERVFAADEVELLEAQSQSLMPELPLDDLEPQQLADLLAYLESLR